MQTISIEVEALLQRSKAKKLRFQAVNGVYELKTTKNKIIFFKKKRNREIDRESDLSICMSKSIDV